MRRHLSRLLPTLLFFASAGGASAAGGERLELVHRSVELPGAPSVVLPADVDGDGRQDLVVAVAYTEWDQIGIEESTEMDDVEGLVEVLTIVPALQDRRELWVFLAADGGAYRAVGPLPLEPKVLSLDAGLPGLPIVAITDEGLSALRLGDDAGGAPMRLEPVLAERPVLARTGAFVPRLGLVHDFDGDGRRDLLFPTADGASVYLGDGEGLGPEPASRPLWPPDDGASERVRNYPLPVVRDVTGDGLDDLLLRDPRQEWERFFVLVNRGEGRFAAPVALGEDEDQDGNEDEDGEAVVVFFGDVDGDGRGEYLTRRELGDDDAGWRKEIKEAKRPPFRYALHRSRPDLTREPEPYLAFEATGYAFEGGDEEEIRVPGGFQDLDGDGRLDLVTLTLDFSLMQAVRILATHSISIGLDFHVWCQREDGRFRAVEGLDLSGKFRLNLDDLRIGQLSQFAGDFDGDGIADFVQMGRGRDVTVHRGREGCVYPPQPDLAIRLVDEPRDLKLVQVTDLDADDLADLLIIQPQKVVEPGVTPPVRLDLYLSEGRE